MKIICIGRNYGLHAKELNNEIPVEPVFFLKPDSAILRNDQPFFIPGFTNEVHYEVELVVRIKRLGKHIEEQFAHRYYDDIGIGIDFTARDVQRELKNNGLPWEKAKAFDRSAAISKFIPLKKWNKEITDVNFLLNLNGKTVQNGYSGDMLFGINRLIAEVSKYMTLKIGDLLFTGTPEGVGPIKTNDKLEAYIENKKMLTCLIK